MNHSFFNALLNVHSVKSSSFSLIRLCGNVFKKPTSIACQRNRAVIASKRPVALLKQGANISKRPFLRNLTCIK